MERETKFFQDRHYVNSNGKLSIVVRGYVLTEEDLLTTFPEMASTVDRIKEEYKTNMIVKILTDLNNGSREE